MAVNSKQTEVWKDIRGYEGFYQVSDRGNVRNSRTKGCIRPYINDNGYCVVGLYNRKVNKSIHYRVHRLVADAFIDNPDRKRTVNHIDGDKANNAVCNLEWATHKENIRHAHNTGLIVATTNQRQAASRNIMKNRLYAKPEKRCFMVDENGCRKEFPSLKIAAGAVSGVSSAISMCCQGKKKTYKGCKWGYC